MGGIVGRLFREFAVTLSAAIMAIPLIISLTTTPMMCSRVLKQVREEQHGEALPVPSRQGDLQWLLQTYASAAYGWVLESPVLTLTVLLVSPSACRSTSSLIVPKGFFPQQDNGTALWRIAGIQDISFQADGKPLPSEFVNMIKADPAVANVMAFIGGNGATNSGFTICV